MKIRNIVHKGLRRLIEDDGISGLPAAAAPKLRNMVSFLQDMDGITELSSFPHWKAHQLGGSRKGTWSLSVTRNWRLTFRIGQELNEIVDLNFEDYH